MVLKWISLILLSILPIFSSASVYKWVDADGNTHFGDRPPANASSREVKVNAPEVNNDASAQERQQRMQDFLSEQQNEREARQAEQAKLAEQEAKKAELCTRMRAELKNLARVSTFYRLDENGDRVYVTDEENEQVRKDFRRKVKEACG